MAVQWWQVLFALLGAALGFLSTAYWTRLNRRDKEQDRLREKHERLQEKRDAQSSEMLNRLISLEKSYALVNQQVIPISTALQAILVKELTHYHTPVMDELMTRIGPPSTLTDEEELQLEEALLERTQDMGQLISDSERDAAFILPAIMRRAKAEAVIMAGMASASTFRFVTVDITADK